MGELDFKDSIKKVQETRNHKVTGSLGVYDAYKFIRKNKWLDLPRPVTEKEFYSIIRRINQYLAEELIKGIEIKLPHSLGSIELRKKPSRLAIVNGRIVTNLPIDWDRTLKLWFDNPEAYKRKQLVHVENEEIFKVYYDKSKADYTNKTFYELKPNREIKRKLVKAAREGKLEAYLYLNYD